MKPILYAAALGLVGIMAGFEPRIVICAVLLGGAFAQL